MFGMTDRKATIIYNPLSGRKGRRTEKAQEMVRLLEARGIRSDACATSAPNDATRLTREAILSGSNIIVSYGGDGTLNEVIQPMVGSNAVLAVWAGGTANVIAKDLQLPKDTRRLAEVIARGKTKRIALGVARGQEPGVSEKQNPHRPPATDPRPLTADPCERYFLMFAGIGLDASISRGVN